MTVHACALSDACGEAELRVPVANGTVYAGLGTIKPMNALSSHEAKLYRVPRVTLDSLDLGEIRFIKIDVEDQELEVPRGAAATLRRWRPNLPAGTENRHRSGAVAAVPGLLKELGYQGFRSAGGDSGFGGARRPLYAVPPHPQLHLSRPLTPLGAEAGQASTAGRSRLAAGGEDGRRALNSP